MLRKREDKNIDVSLRDDISKYLLHYEPTCINRRNDFKKMTLPELWGEKHNFYQFLFDEVNNYLDAREYCPFAVCGGVRVKIEEIAYCQLQNPTSKKVFLSEKMTRPKLEKAEEMGIVSPESHYLLGIIYNEGMHWKENQDNVSPIASKLENLTIKKLISDIFSGK